MNPRSDLAQLLNSLPEHEKVPDSDLEGRVPLPVGTELRKGDYTLNDVIGCGSFGLIYSAIDARIGQELAIKEFFPCNAYGKREATS